MSGAIIVEGIDQYYPQVRDMRERVLILRDQDLEHSEAGLRERMLQRVGVTLCGTADEQKPRANLHSERRDSTSDSDRSRGASVLAHCQRLS
jgi:hypothetical protein